MATAEWIEAPLQVLARAAGPSPIDAVAAVASVLALERVAPFAVVLLDGGESSGAVIVTASTAALGVLSTGAGPDVARALAGSGVAAGASIFEDEQGRWFVSDDDAHKVELVGVSAWALTGVALGAPRFFAGTPAGHAFAASLHELRGGQDAEALLEASLSWARGEIDLALGRVAVDEPGRVRRWLTELMGDQVRLRDAHDALRSRYDVDLRAVAGGNDD